MEETHYHYWLTNIPGVGNITINKLLNYAGSAYGIWNLSKKDLKSANLQISDIQIKSILDSKNEDNIISNYEKVCMAGIKYISDTSPDFPLPLKHIPNSPHCLYLKGTLPHPSKTSIAIVGARTCSDYGRYVAHKISHYLAQNDFQIISGMARGIDVISQKSALDAGGYSLAVLGCGVDICYPPENNKTYDLLSNHGGIISEYPPGTAPKAAFFPMRNRIISALADIVIVIEAREKSGSLITADLALEQGKEIYALPGRVTDSLSHGCNRLIRQGAGIILSPEEFVQDLAVNYSLKKAQKNGLKEDDLPKSISLTDTFQASLSPKEQGLLSLIDFTPQSIGSIQEKSPLPFQEIMNILMDLTLKGAISQIGSFYVRTC